MDSYRFIGNFQRNLDNAVCKPKVIGELGVHFGSFLRNLETFKRNSGEILGFLSENIGHFDTDSNDKQLFCVFYKTPRAALM